MRARVSSVAVAHAVANLIPVAVAVATMVALEVAALVVPPDVVVDVEVEDGPVDVEQADIVPVVVAVEFVVEHAFGAVTDNTSS